MMPQQHSFFLNSDGEQLAATVLLPKTVLGAVLFLLPFAEERKGCLPFYMSIARTLCDKQIASLIFDWHGSGDSTGDFESSDPQGFLRDAATAVRWIQEHLPRIPITALGTRLAALLLTELAADHKAIQRTVLIAPASGAEFIHQLLQRRMVNDMVAYGQAVESRASLLEQVQSGGAIDLDGYIFSARVYAWITEVGGQRSKEHPTSNIQHPASNKHLLLIPGGHSPKTFKVIKEQNAAAQFSELRFPPFWNTVGHVDLSQLRAEIKDWITADFSASLLSAQLPEFKNATTRTRLIDITLNGATIRAAMDQPQGVATAGVLFLAGWSGDRTGPHRMFTELSRQLTQSGHLCMRPDFRGRGLSDGSHDEASIDSMAEDAAAALAELQKQLSQGTPVYVAAICSGCKVAIKLVAANLDISKLLLLSAESMGSLRSAKTDAHKTQKALLTYLKKLTQLETWKKILTGRVQTKMVTKALIKHESRSNEEAKSENQTLQLFIQYCNPVHFVFGGSDPDAPGSMQAYTEYCAKHSIPSSFRLIPHAGHSYYSAAWTAEVFATSIKFLTHMPPEG
ncbi:MAG: alpha/beta fold hydrolase [Kiritimatiellia bacterium]